MDNGKVFESLVHLAASKGIMVKFAPLKASYARIEGNKIALSDKLETIEDFNYNLAHELAHYFLHYDKGDIMPGKVNEELLEQYEEQADRAAKMLVAALSVRQKGGAA